MIGRSRGLNMSAMTVCAIGNKPPPPMPCNARAAISTQIDGAIAQATEPMMKTPIADSMMARRP